jgi:GT2 family glycosyltransferase
LISVIVCSIDELRFAAVKAMYAAAMGGAPWELVGIHDAKSMAEGYARGLAQARGDSVVFSHDDIEIISPDFVGRLTGHLANYDVVGVAGTSRLVRAAWPLAGPPYIFGQVAHPQRDGTFRINIYGAPKAVIGGMQALDGLLLAANRSVFSRVGFDAEAFDGFHLYDIDFSYRAYNAGLRLAVANDICLVHHSPGSYDAAWQRYARIFEQRWATKLPSVALRRFTPALVSVRTREEAIEVMTPWFW